GFLSVIITKDNNNFQQLLTIPIDSVIAVEGTKKDRTCFAKNIYYPKIIQKNPQKITIKTKITDGELIVTYKNQELIIPNNKTSLTTYEPFEKNFITSPFTIENEIILYNRDLTDALTFQEILLISHLHPQHLQRDS